MLENLTIGLACWLRCAAIAFTPAHAADEFPFGLEMTLDAPPMPGSKRRPSIEIGDAGEARVELCCKGGKGQFSIAGNTVVFVAGRDGRARLFARADRGRRCAAGSP